METLLEKSPLTYTLRRNIYVFKSKRSNAYMRKNMKKSELLSSFVSHIWRFKSVWVMKEIWNLKK